LIYTLTLILSLRERELVEIPAKGYREQQKAAKYFYIIIYEALSLRALRYHSKIRSHNL